MRLRLLDLFCGAGGAAKGYADAGFQVVGVDLKHQRHYPFEFHQADALEFPLGGFDVIHASPPCQRFSMITGSRRVSHSDLIGPVRKRLQEASCAYVIENVPQAPLINPLKLCGSMFPETMELRRHRCFESNMKLHPVAGGCRHDKQSYVVPVYGHPGNAANRGREQVRSIVEPSDWMAPVNTDKSVRGLPNHVSDWRRAMGIDWMTGRELAQAIPPTYTYYIGKQLQQQLGAECLE